MTDSFFYQLVQFSKDFYHKLSLYREKYWLARIYKKYISGNTRVADIHNITPDDNLITLSTERSLPLPPLFPDGWWRTMLLRYGLAINFSKKKEVLETCSGLGWGGYLLDGVAKKVVCVEQDEKAILAAKKIWKSKVTVYKQGSVLELKQADSSFEVATAMESLEHFSFSDIKKYLQELYRVLKTGGILIGSSYFPETREEADKVCRENEHHLYVLTGKELIELLSGSGFKKIKIFKNKLFFIAKK